MSRLRVTLISLLGAALLAILAVLLLLREPPAETPPGAVTVTIAGAPESSLPGDRPTLYRCPMHPNVVMPGPGNCPICGMDLRAVRDAAPQSPPAQASPRDGVVRVSHSFLQNFAVRTAEVRRGPLTISTRAVGVLAHDEARLVSVNTKFAGWIEEARINNIGESVEAGDVLFEVYSPEVVTTEREYLAAVAYLRRLREGGAYREAVDRAASLLAAARERLRNWDISQDQIDALDTRGTASRRVRILAPASGIVVDKSGDSLEGMRVNPGQTVLKIADHTRLWAEADFDEEALPHVREGSPVTVEVDAFPERRWEGRILFFRSAVNPETRALTAFVEIANPDLSLRPMMDVTVSADHLVTPDAVLVPVESVLHSGERAIVVVDRGGGLFEPRSVVLGPVAGDRQQVTAGLSPGERVVVSSQFLIDSESNLKAAVAQLFGDGGSAESAAGPHRH
ncbi:MAG: efflux RND transporter periplasmic adaptor subunit [Gammaproteobacteria bacterium]|nr:efflux RND transporter periplasmic adaptor subunit [Gammaproteobacteria bacterium]